MALATPPLDGTQPSGERGTVGMNDMQADEHGLAEARGALAATRALLTVATALAATDDAFEAARVVTEQVRDIFAADATEVQLRRPDGSFVLAHTAGDFTPAECEVLRTSVFNQPIHAMLERERQVIPIDDLAASGLADPEYLRLIRRRSTMLVPFVGGDELLGYWGIHYIHAPHPFLPREVALAEGIARQATIALDHIRLRQTEREKSARLEAMHHLTANVLAHRDLETVLDDVIEQAIRLTGRDHGSVLLWDRAENGLRVVASQGREPRIIGQVSHDPSLAFEAFRRNAPQVANDYQNDPRADPDGVRSGVVAAIAVPLSLQGRSIGALIVSDRASSGRFNDDDIHVLGLLANHAALAIENARLLQQVREAARLEGAVETARGLAHELNHPLAIIVGQAEILRLLTDPTTPISQIEPKLIEIVEASQLLADKIRRLQRIVRVETNEMPGIGRYIDLDRSSANDYAIG